MMYEDDLTPVSLTSLKQANNWQAKYRLITQWGMLIAPKPAIRSVQNQIRGCESSAWLVARPAGDGCFRFEFDSDSRVIKGLAALLLSIINNRSINELTQLDFSRLLQDAGLEKHMTPSRNNGFRAIVLRINELIQQIEAEIITGN